LNDGFHIHICGGAATSGAGTEPSTPAGDRKRCEVLARGALRAHDAEVVDVVSKELASHGFSPHCRPAQESFDDE
jgi:hypothetical protein